MSEVAISHKSIFRPPRSIVLWFLALGIISVASFLPGLAAQKPSETAVVVRQADSQPSQPTIAQTLLDWRELLPVFSRSGFGPRETSAEVYYMSPLFFQALGEEIPAESLKQPTLVFRLIEADHEHTIGLTPEPPQAFLRIDGGSAIEPYQLTILRDGDDHRTAEYLFPIPNGMSQETLEQGKRTLSFVIPAESGENSVLEWQLPLELPKEATSAAAATVVPQELASPQVLSMNRLLTHTLDNVQYGGGQGIGVEATYATPEYVANALPKGSASRYLPEQFTLFLITEKLHTADLPASLPDLVLSLNGQDYKPDLVDVVTTSPHHRVTLVRFPEHPPAGLQHQIMTLSLSGEGAMTWHLPVNYAGLESSSGFKVSWVWLLAVLGGLIAAMWPCLFQLTVFFIPALAGLSMHDASGAVPLPRRVSVVKAALFFVLGFTLVYTAAGALIGFAAGRLGDLSSFYVWQRYLAVAGGIVIVFLALRAAAQVRAPLVCKMPVLSRMGERRRPANPAEMMVAGVAFATGCMTCFGAAIVVAMVVYVGLAGSALIGAFTLLLFSLGMGVPLVLAASAMTRVMPLLSRFEKGIRWIGLASSLVMVGFAILLITGNYMAITEWVFRSLPAVIPK